MRKILHLSTVFTLEINTPKYKIGMGFLALLSATPFVYFQIVNDPAHSPVYFYLLLLIFPFLCYSFFTSKEIGYIFFNPITAMLSMIVIGGFFSVIILKDNSESRLELGRITSLLIFYIAILLWLQQQKKIDFLLYSVFLMGTGYLLFGWIDFYNFYDTTDAVYNGLYNIKAHIGHKNLLAIFLTVSFPLVFYVVQKGRYKFFQTIALFYFILASILILLSQSRVGYIGLILLAFFAVFYFYLIGNNKWFYRLGITLFVGAIIVYFSLSQFEFSKPIAKRISSIVLPQKEQNANSQTIYERLELWKTTLALIRENPLLGVGLGQWKIQAPGKNLNNTRAKYGYIIFQQPHNDWLWFFAEYGIVGFVFYGGLFAFVFYHLIRQIFLKRKRQESFLFDFVLLTGLAVYFVESLFDFPKERPTLLFLWAIYLALFSFSYFATNKNLYFLSRFLLVIFIVADLIGVIYFLNRTRHEYLLSSLLQYRKAQNFQAVISLSEMLKEVDFEFDYTSTPVSFYEGESYFLLGNKEKALEYMTQAIKESPYHLYSWSNLGGVYYALQNTESAIAAWNKAIAIAPNFAEPHINKAIYEFKKRNFSQAATELEFDITTEDFAKYKKEIKTICQNYFYREATTLQDTLLVNEMKTMAKNETYVLYIYKRSRDKKITFKKCALDELIYKLEKMENRISNEEALFFRNRYQLIFEP